VGQGSVKIQLGSFFVRMQTVLLIVICGTERASGRRGFSAGIKKRPTFR
jgi:hypothetical protein